MDDWNGFLNKLYEIQNRNELGHQVSEMIEMTKNLNIPLGLDLKKCLENFDIVKNYSCFDYRAQNFGTESITTILTEKKLGLLSPHYSTWFIACFPDVYIWAHNANSTDNNFDCLTLLETFMKSKDLYFTKDAILNAQAYSSLCSLYIKQIPAFETK